MLVTGETVCLITVQSFAMRVETVLYLWYFGVIIIDLMDCILLALNSLVRQDLLVREGRVLPFRQTSKRRNRAREA